MMPILTFYAIGIASMFYPQDFSPALHVSTPYVCAMNYVKVGTHVVVVDESTGRQSHCIITGTGPCCGRILDASPIVADELGYGNSIDRVSVYLVKGYKNYPIPDTCKSYVRRLRSTRLPKPVIVTCSIRF